MKLIRVLILALIAAAITACGSTAAPAAHAPKPAPTRSAVNTSRASEASSNEQQFAQGMSQPAPSVPSQLVAGPVMDAYLRFEHAYGSAWSAANQAVGETVIAIPDGYKLCDSDDCQAFTGFTANTAGQITGVSVDGQPVAGRISAGSDSSSGGLTITGVTAYRLTSEQNVSVVAFKLTDTDYTPINTSPSLLASLNGVSDNTSYDALPSDLRPGDTLYAAAGFGVSQFTGLFCLQPNDGEGEKLPCTTLGKA
jgi:hypothetical protein